MFGDTIIYNAQASNSDLETVIRNKFKLKILCQYWLSASIKKIWIKIAEEMVQT